MNTLKLLSKCLNKAVAILAFCFSFIPSSAWSGTREKNALSAVEELRIDSKRSQTGTSSLSHTLNHIKTDKRSRALATLQSGLQYLEKAKGSNSETDLKIAFQYLTAAEGLADRSDGLWAIVRYHRALALAQSEAHLRAAGMLEELLGNNIGPGWEQLAWTQLIQSLYTANQSEKVVNAYSEYTTRFSPSRRDQDVAMRAASVLLKKGTIQSAVELLEDLTAMYPMSQQSVWSFNQLLTLSCDTQASGKYRYYWSRDLLLRLARNTTLETGLREFVVGQLDLPLRVSEHEVRLLADHEKIEFLLRSRYFKEAMAAAQDALDYRDTEENNAARRARTLIQLGRAHAGLNDHEMAIRYFSMFVEEFPGLQEAFRARELLADSLNRLRHFSDAALEYGRLAEAKGDGNPLLKWHHFWNTYLAGQYPQALELLDRPGYVPPRDRNETAGLSYWRATILSKIGKSSDAESMFRQILESDGGSFYATLIASKYPQLVKRKIVKPDSPAEGVDEGEDPIDRNLVTPVALSGEESLESSEAALPDREAEPRDVLTDLSADMVLVDELLKLGLDQVAKTHLKGIPWRNYQSSDTWLHVHRIALELNDYRGNLQSPYRSGSPLRSRPRSWWGLTDHQKQHNNDWRTYFPFAYERTVKKSAQKIGVNPFLVLSLMRAESHYNADAKSPVGALGLMQIMPYTGVRIAQLIEDRNFEVSELKRPERNIPYGTYYIKRLVSYFGGNPVLAIASYNAGPIAVRNWLEASKGQQIDEFIESIPFLETRRYVKSVLRNYTYYLRIHDGNGELPKIPELPLQLPDGEEIF